MPPARTALLVDDDPGTSEAVRSLLPWRQVKLESTANAHQAIECLKKHTYCGVVLNLALSNDGSQEVLRHLSEQRSAMPIVVITSKFPDALRDDPIAGAIKLVLARPFDPSLLASIILGLCGIRS
jgi:CheY-like chemotaxis protein